VHAIVSTLVTVANTSANAVPVSSSNEPAVEAYQDFCLGHFSNERVDCAFQTLPAGKRLVIQDIHISLAASPGVRPYYVALFTPPMARNFSATAPFRTFTAISPDTWRTCRRIGKSGASISPRIRPLD
jgi:hypothetical protein